MLFRIVSGIPEKHIDWNVLDGLPHRRQKGRRVVAGADFSHHSGDQMGFMIRDGGQFGEESKLLHSAAFFQKMTADVVTFHAGGVDGGIYRL